MRYCTLCLLLALSLRGESELKTLYDGHRWFELRDAIQGKDAPNFYRGAVAAAFDDCRRAERLFAPLFRSPDVSGQAYDARGMLSDCFRRTGDFRPALAEVERMLALQPDRADARGARQLYSALARYPGQTVAKHRRSEVRATVKSGSLFVPLTVNGTAASYILDTNANVSALSESEARRLGLTIDPLPATAMKTLDATGRPVGFRVTVAPHVIVGKVELRNVVFLVFADDQEPWKSLAPGERGLLGLPLLLALKTVRWKPDGTFEIGARSRRRNIRTANLCFDGADVLTRAAFRERPLTFVLDTGAASTGLWPPFAAQFRELLNESGTASPRSFTGIGGPATFRAMTLPEVPLVFGRFLSVLRPAVVLLDHTTPDSHWQDGRLGLDLLTGPVVILDFRAMTLTLQ